MSNNKDQDLPSPIPPTESGWFYSKLSGSYSDIGYQHGATHFYMINKIISRMKDYTYWSTGLTWDFLKDKIWGIWWNNIPAVYQQEMQGIASGAADKGATEVTVQDVFLWNCYMEVLYYYYPTFKNILSGVSNLLGKATPPCSCSAFIAVGDYTSDSKIVMAHNSFTGYELAYMHLALDITVPDGSRFVMQTSPGQICSNTDFGVNSKGLMITETTIGGFENYCSDAGKIGSLMPEFIRARMAMEQAGSLDDFKKIMLDKNTGGYANSWLVGDTNVNKIMRFELGYTHSAVTILDNGYLAGFNAPLDPCIRNLECSNTGYMDIRRHQGARQVRIPQLVEANKGKITAELARDILADHMDPYLSSIEGKEITNVCARNIDAHYELDPRQYMSQIGRPLPYQPQGAADGKTSSSDMAKNLDFYARWGSSSDIGFDADDFFARHPQYADMRPFIDSRPANPWIRVSDMK